MARDDISDIHRSWNDVTVYAPSGVQGVKSGTDKESRQPKDRRQNNPTANKDHDDALRLSIDALLKLLQEQSQPSLHVDEVDWHTEAAPESDITPSQRARMVSAYQQASSKQPSSKGDTPTESVNLLTQIRGLKKEDLHQLLVNLRFLRRKGHKTLPLANDIISLRELIDDIINSYQDD